MIALLLASGQIRADTVSFLDSETALLFELMPMDSAPMDLALPSSQFGIDVFPQTAVMLGNVPTSSWTYGCSATSAGMMFGYYDRIGYIDMYDGEVPDYMGNSHALIATSNHVTDYWISSGSEGPDPWEDNGWDEHPWEDCTADFMGTNQWKWDFIGSDEVKDFNKDGGTALFSYSSASKLYDYIPPESAGLPRTALSHGTRLFAESRGYTVLENYTQKIDAVYEGGFSFANYMSEIDSGYPVMIQITGHSMVGVGYDESDETVYVHDTWGDYVGSMTWGEPYSGRAHLSMTVMHLDPAGQMPEPGTLTLLLVAVPLGLLKLRRQKLT